MADDQTQAPPPAQPPPATPAVPPPGSPESQARTWNMLCHLSALAGLLIPFGNILGPLLVWQIKKNEIPSTNVHGKAALNFQITVAIALLVSFLAGAILSFICIGVVFFFIAGGIALCSFIFAIIAGVKANNGEDYKYPYTLELVK